MCSHKKSFSGGEYPLTLTICEGDDYDYHIVVERCDWCKAYITSIYMKENNLLIKKSETSNWRNES